MQTSLLDCCMENHENAILFIIDDEINILHALRRLFFPLGCAIQTFSNPIEALTEIKNQRPEVIISDERMPEMTGVELLAQARKVSPFSERIIMTAYSDNQALINAINLGNVHFFTAKPWNEHALTLAVKNGMHNASTRRKSYTLDLLLKKQNAQLKENNLALAIELEGEKKKVDELYCSTINTLVRIIEKATNDSDPSIIIADVCDLIAKNLNVPDEQRKALNYAVLLRHIGKIGFSKLLREKISSNKPLSPEEETEYKKYPLNAKLMLSLLEPLSECADILYQVEERNDGSGFPLGLTQNQIRIEARILATSCAFFNTVSANKTDDNPAQTFERFIKENESRFDMEIMLSLKVFHQSDHYKINTHSSDRKTLSVHALQPGMELADDFCSESGVLMLSKNTVLTPSVIEQLNTIQNHASTSLSLDIYKCTYTPGAS